MTVQKNLLLEGVPPPWTTDTICKVALWVLNDSS